MPDYASHIYRSAGLINILQEALNFFNETPLCPLPPEDAEGCGVYALYYLGDFPLYEKLVAKNANEAIHPIYVGKAEPKGVRTARGETESDSAARLKNRLAEHARSIQVTSNLQLAHFTCRFIIMDMPETIGIIRGIESALIRKYRPLWNTSIDGFGNHPPGAGRAGQKISAWDILHPGRSFNSYLTGGESRTREQLEDIIRQALAD